MSRRANPTLIGGFVLGAVALVVAGILVFGGGRLFSEREKFVLFFQGSVNGLSAGSPVKFRGVPLGQVTAVRIVADPQMNRLDIEALIEIDRSTVIREGEAATMRRANLQELIERGLRAKLELASLLTGQLFIQLDLAPDSPVQLVGFDAEYPEIPTIPSDLEQLKMTAGEIIAEIRKLPLAEVATRLSDIANGVDRLINSPELASTLENLDGALADTRQLITSLNQRVGPLSQSALTVLSRAERTIERVEQSVEPDSPLRYELATTLAELRGAARAIRQLAEFIEENPNSLVFGNRSRGQ